MKRIKSVRGVEVYETSDGLAVVFIRYSANGKRQLERVGPAERVKGRDVTEARARRLLNQRRVEIQEARANGRTWESPRAKAQAQQKQAVQIHDARAALLFDVAAPRFLTEHAGEYARPKVVRGAFRLEPGGAFNRPGPLAEAFGGRYLDEIDRADVRQYFLDRMQNTGPFVGRPGDVSKRVPEVEISYLSALYTCLVDEGHVKLESPCHRPETKRKDSPLATYRPKHKPVIPSKAAVRDMLEARARAVVGPRSRNRVGRELIGDTMRAFVALCYYSGARPESEPCRLTHGDVVLGDAERWGSITYRDTKTGGDRSVPLHPEAARYLKAIMKPVPIDQAEREQWATLPVFRRRGSARASWDKSSYTKGWGAILRAVAPIHGDVAGMWLRDLRPTFKTLLVDAGVPSEMVKVLMGHKGDVADGYYVARAHELRRALEHLTLTVASGVPESTSTPVATSVQPRPAASSIGA